MNSQFTGQQVEDILAFANIEVLQRTESTFTLTPNKFHVWGEISSLSLTLAPATGKCDEYLFQFTSGATATSLTLPASIKWIGSNEIEASKTYFVSIINGIAVMGGAV